MCIIFFLLVGLNYLSKQAGNFLASHPALAQAQADSDNMTYDDLPYVNVNFFNASGLGRNYITQGYGRTPYAYLYINGWHNGIDIAANFGTPVYSLAAGIVLATINQDTYCPHIAFGKYVAIDDPVKHLVFVLSHFGTFAVAPNERITKGTFLGTVGPTGLETGPHLLVSIFKEVGFSLAPAHGCGPYPQGQDVDPLNYLGTTYQ